MPDPVLTATAKAIRVAEKVAQTLTAMPTGTPTATPNFSLTETVEAEEIEAAAASTLTAIAPTLTPTDTPTVTPTSAPGATYVSPIDGATYRHVPAGEFIMGSEDGNSDESPQHTVYLDAYWIMETEVTNAQYRKFMEADGYRTEAYWSAEGWSWRDTRTEPGCWDNSDKNGGKQPVICVSWYEAQSYAKWLATETGFDIALPTEAEWEKAARGTDGRVYPWGNEWDGRKANSKGTDDYYGYTSPVGSYLAGASPYRALDMAGNVWEWTADWYDSEYYNDSYSRNPIGPQIGERRVIRGGSWNNNPDGMRAANRHGFNPGQSGLDSVGIRLRLDLSPD